MHIFFCVYSGETPALYTVLPEKQASVGGAMMGSAHVYDIAAVSYLIQKHRATGPQWDWTAGNLTHVHNLCSCVDQDGLRGVGFSFET